MKPLSSIPEDQLTAILAAGIRTFSQMLWGPDMAMCQDMFERGIFREIEPPDHLAVELEYLYFLLTKGWTENHAASIAKAVSFASDTMLPCIKKLQERLNTREASRFYSLLMSLIIAVLQYIGASA